MNETNIIMKEFHAGDCGGHLYWKSTTDKILRATYYWPSPFADVKKFVVSCHKCQTFEGKRKLLPSPLKPISTEKPFQQWGLDFIGEIHPSSSGQHKWILTATDYFTKWIEAIHVDKPTTQPLSNSLRAISFPDLATLRKSSLTTLLPSNPKRSSTSATNTTLPWATPQPTTLKTFTKKSIGMSPYELVYGMEAKFPSSLGIPTIKLLQEIQVEPNDMQRRVNQTIHLQQTREQVYDRAQMLQEKLKKMFDKKAKAEDFWVGSKVLRWDSRREDKGKHSKFNFLWKWPYIISAVQGNNTYCLKSLDGSIAEEGPVNGQMLKHYNDPF
eukprot:PITA_24960